LQLAADGMFRPVRAEGTKVVTPRKTAPVRRVRKAEEPAWIACFDSQGRLVGIIDERDLKPVRQGTPIAEAQSASSGPAMASNQALGLTPAPSAQVGTPADDAQEVEKQARRLLGRPGIRGIQEARIVAQSVVVIKRAKASGATEAGLTLVKAREVERARAALRAHRARQQRRR
jgi:hypothetical protein